MKILLVEDDEALAELLKNELTAHHYLVDVAFEGNLGWQLAEGIIYDLILLDVGLPQLNGIEFCQKRRKKGDRTPILLMTAQDSSNQKVTGLDAGADDYLTKPFDLPELLARIRALLRRGNNTRLPILTWGKLRLDPGKCQVMYGQNQLKLTAKEYELLELFLRHPERIFSQSAILDHLWCFDDPPSENAVRTHIKSLRQKLKKAGTANDLIETVYGLGYRLKARNQESSATQNSGIPPAFLPIWERYQHQYCDRLKVIQTTLDHIPTGFLNPDSLHDAIRESHTLAGSLGSFGLTRLSEVARQIEHTLKTAQDRTMLRETIAPQIEELHQGLTQNSPEKPTSPPPEIPLPHILTIEPDPIFAQALKEQAIRAHFNLKMVSTLSEGKEQMQQQRPDLILLELSLPQTSRTQVLEWITSLSSAQPPIPVVVVTEQNTLNDRVAVARAGGEGFLQKPILAQEAIASVRPFLKGDQTQSPQLLIVDDDCQLLAYLEEILTPWGFEITSLDHPQAFWHILQQIQPDLVLLDIEMPEVTGIELCQVLRNDPQWMALPVLFLSSHQDSETIQQVFLAGADDYIQKPIVEPELIARILNRLERRKVGSKGRSPLQVQRYLHSS
ncbi:response regulator [Roseofilum reptotaenium CS-1145]|uniref:Transcriptional regulator n=1 Tax=Roseofilum reptotaenium AO1-A TaxID=1925591 RepID=A0A1L9QNF4_9CYAN|nr:response regulator [Roseofilum reptotaenium]MDB9517076.1 response regulator [Roseofilum reptotaenium CS-1145]OJJ24179.1 transcriptional regulator [Roseofilum reptotaenium AO1-A]